MSKRSRLSLGLGIQPGVRATDVISAATKGGNAEAVVRTIARRQGMRCRKEFGGEWSDEGGISSICGTVRAYGGEFKVTLKIGTSEGFVIADVPGRCRSMRPKKGEFAISIGNGLTADQIERVADEVAACWIVHGRNWTDRSGDLVSQPYGRENQSMPPGNPLFRIIDGKNEPFTIQELINRGCTRSTHVGEWKERHSTLIVALCGMRTILHEFKSEGADDICSCNGTVIGELPKLWGPYCPWNETGRMLLSPGRWSGLAARAATPFAFHVHATREIIPNAELESSFLLRELGRERLMDMFEAVAAEDPERFYRLIDGNGRMHRLTQVNGVSLVYGGRIAFERGDVAKNVVMTFEDLAGIQNDSGRSISREPRIVPDTHAYIVAEAIAARSGTLFSQSGRDMHRYLTAGGSASMHRIRNERLFRLWKGYGTMESVELKVYPPIEADSGLVSQYGDTDSFKAWQWLRYKA